jgi:hypothetical protein
MAVSVHICYLVISVYTAPIPKPILVDPLAGVETKCSLVNWLTGLLVNWLTS